MTTPATPEEDFDAIAAQAERAASGNRPGAAIARLGFIAGAVWCAAAAIAIALYVGPSQLAFTPLPVLILMGAGVLLPSVMIWISAAAAAEGARARHAAQKLAEATERLLNPSDSAEASARRLAASVRVEISALDRALEQTIAKLNAVQAALSHQQTAADKISVQAQQSGGRLVSGLERERAELQQIAEDLNKRANLISDSIAQHTAAITQAAALAEKEVKAADSVLEQKLASFSAAAALINDRTGALDSAAQTSAESTLRLEQALSNALEVLSRAASLTDSARQSADAALNAARATADALQDTTARAIEDARRAADIVRGESARVERDAAAALDRLGAAADQTRRALPREEAPPEPGRRERMRPADADPSSFSWSPAQPRGRAREHGDQQGDWSWRDLLSNSEGEDEPRPAPRSGERAVQPPIDPVARLANAVAEQRARPGGAILALLDGAGVKVGEVFSSAALDRIAQRARNGTQARRKAVKDAAPDAVRRLAEHLRADQAARAEAANFLRQDGARIAEQMGRGRGSMGADSTRAFLLLDAASG